MESYKVAIFADELFDEYDLFEQKCLTLKERLNQTSLTIQCCDYGNLKEYCKSLYDLHGIKCEFFNADLLLGNSNDKLFYTETEMIDNADACIIFGDYQNKRLEKLIDYAENNNKDYIIIPCELNVYDHDKSIEAQENYCKSINDVCFISDGFDSIAESVPL